MITTGLVAGLSMLGLALAIYVTGRRRQEAEAAARDVEAMRAANEAHQRRMDDLLGPGPKDGPMTLAEVVGWLASAAGLVLQWLAGGRRDREPSGPARGAGDIVTVITSNPTTRRIRLFGIDAPETLKAARFPGQPYGMEAEAYLKRLVEGKRVRVEIYQVDRYRRLLSTIFLDGKDINLALLEAGLAEMYRGPESGNPCKSQYQAAEDAARAA